MKKENDMTIAQAADMTISSGRAYLFPTKQEIVTYPQNIYYLR